MAHVMVPEKSVWWNHQNILLYLNTQQVPTVAQRRFRFVSCERSTVSFLHLSRLIHLFLLENVHFQKQALTVENPSGFRIQRISRWVRSWVTSCLANISRVANAVPCLSLLRGHYEYLCQKCYKKCLKGH